jgi:hypothetical protein
MQQRTCAHVAAVDITVVPEPLWHEVSAAAMNKVSAADDFMM